MRITQKELFVMDFTFSLPLLTQFVLAGEAWEECSLLLGFHLKDSSFA